MVNRKYYKVTGWLEERDDDMKVHRERIDEKLYDRNKAIKLKNRLKDGKMTTHNRKLLKEYR